jgi:hypothetical protein
MPLTCSAWPPTGPLANLAKSQFFSMMSHEI